MPEIQTITRTVYTYNELDDRAKERVAAWLNEGLEDIGSDIELFIDPDPEMQNYPAYVMPTYHLVHLMNGKTRQEIDHYAEWGGPYHLSIGYVVDIPEFMRQHKIAGKYRAIYNAAVRGDITARVTNSAAYGYRTRDKYNQLDLDHSWYHGHSEERIDLLRDLLTTDMEQRIDHLSDQLRQECEYHWSDEYIAECCDANEYRFTEEGAPV